MPPHDFNPASIDATLATVLERQTANAIEFNRRFDELIAEMRSMKQDHSGRLQALERWRYYIAGAAAGVGLLFHALWDWLTHSNK